MLETELKHIGDSLFKKLKELQKTKGDEGIGVTDISAVIESVIHSFQDAAKNSNQTIQDEIRGILSHLHETRDELNRASGAGISKAKILDASQHLGEVVKATENAANSILDSAEEIQKIAKEVGGNVAKKLEAVVTRIYEACNFQDLTGQRIKNVSKTLALIEERLSRVARGLGVAEEKPESFEKSLMNGPQHSGKAPSQSDVDDLFAKAPAQKN